MRNRSFVPFVMLVILGFSALPAGAQQKKEPAARHGAGGSEMAQHSTEDSLALSPLETQVMGQNHWLRGGPAALRVIVLDHGTGKPVRAEVSLSLEHLDNGKPSGLAATLFSGHTNGLGTLDAQFTAPEAPPGA